MPATRVAVAGALALAAGALTATFAGLFALDTATRDWLIERRSPVLTAVMTGVTILGSAVVLVPLAVAVTGWLWVRGRRREALLVGGTTLGTQLLGPLLKNVVERSRPQDAHLVLVDSSAYPSGHSLTSAAVIGVLTTLASARVTTRAARRTVVAAGVALVVAVGVSRIYLGVHWPTDVVAGWLIGALWLALCLMVHDAPRLRRDSPPR